MSTTEAVRPQNGTTGDGILATAPQLTPEMIIGERSSTTTTTMSAPALVPPGSSAAASANAGNAGITTSATVTGLWTNNSASNAYAYLGGVGWRRLSSANATSHQALVQLARVARDSGASVQCEQDGSVIHSMYVW